MGKLILVSLILSIVLLTGCASGPQYPKYRTAEEALNNYDTNNYKDGIVQVKSGALVDVKFKEVVSQRDELQTKLDRANDDINYRNGRIQELEAQVMELRVHMGLPARRPANKVELGKDGYINKATFVPSPTLDAELTTGSR